MDAISWRLREKIMGLLCGQKWVCIWTILYPSPQLSCVNNSQSFSRSRKKSCVDWPVPAHHHVCVRAHSTRMHTMFNACTSHIHYRLCCSFILPLHPPPPLMWDTLESEEYSPGEWNRVDLRFSLSGRGLPLILVLSQILSAAFKSLTPSSPPFHKHPLLPSFLLILRDGHYSRRLNPLLHL